MAKFSDTAPASEVSCSRVAVGSSVGAMGKLSAELNKFGASEVSPNKELIVAGTEDGGFSVGEVGMTLLS